jgi:hypothetical protein
MGVSPLYQIDECLLEEMGEFTGPQCRSGARSIKNFCRIHKSLRVTPAMAAGISDHVWDVRENLGGMTAFSTVDWSRPGLLRAVLR